MLWVGGRNRLCALNCMALRVTAVLLWVHYLVLSSCDGRKAHTPTALKTAHGLALCSCETCRGCWWWQCGCCCSHRAAFDSKQQAPSGHAVLSCGAICYVLADHQETQCYRVAQSAMCSQTIRTRSVTVWRNLLCARSSAPQPLTVNSQTVKRCRAVETVTSHKAHINPLKLRGHYIDHQVYQRKVSVRPHSVCTYFI